MSKRFVRNKHSICLTDRDKQILEAVFYARYLTNQMVARLFFTPSTFSSCKNRLRKLFDGGYLSKRLTYPNEPDVYFLGLKGRQYLSSLGEYAREEVDRIAGVKGDCQAPVLMMSHELTLSKLYVNAVLECRKYGFAFRWKNARMLELARLGVQPDAYLSIKGKERHEAFIEFTAVMPSRGEMKRKLDGYEALFRDHPIPVLWLTTSRNKLTQLSQVILRTSSNREHFGLGLIEHAGEFLTREMWFVVDSEKPQCFIKAR